jgi:hypothetical protein
VVSCLLVGLEIPLTAKQYNPASVNRSVFVCVPRCSDSMTACTAVLCGRAPLLARGSLGKMLVFFFLPFSRSIQQPELCNVMARFTD